MKKQIKKVVGMALALCMAVVTLCGGVAEVKAAGYKKSFTKTINITGGLLQMTIDTKEDCNVTVTISTKNKSKNLKLNAKMWNADRTDQTGVEFKKGDKKKTFKIYLKKGSNVLYIENFTYDPKTYEPKSVKVKIKVSTKDGKVLKYGGKEIMEDVG